MPKTKISEYSATANSNTDVASINIDEGCAPSGINNAIRAIMGHLKDFQSGTSNDPFTVGSSGSLTLSYGTANGVAYLNGSKVLTTGSALVFDGTNLGIGTTSPSDTIGYGRALDIQSTTGAAIYLRDSDNPTTQYAAIAFDGNASVNNLNIINSSSTGPIRLFTNGAERARIDSSGNLGIGTSSPAELLTVGNASGVKNILLKSTDNNVAFKLAPGNGATAGLRFNNSSGTQHWNIFQTTGAAGQQGNLGIYNEVGAYTALTLDTSGNLLVGKTSTSATVGGGVVYLGRMDAARDTGDVATFKHTAAGNTVGSISITSTATTYSTSSDYRLKNITGPLIGAKDFIMALQPKQGTWKTDGSKFVGFLAHEFQEVSPSSVSGVKDAVDEDGKPIMQSMQASSSEVIANMVSLLQEQQAIITQLTARITALEGA